MSYDVSIVFDTKIDIDGLSKNINEMLKQLNTFKSLLSKMGKAAGKLFDNVITDSNELGSELSIVRDNANKLIEDLEQIGKKEIKSNSVVNLEKQIDSALSSIDWGTIRKTVASLGENIGNFLNEAVSGLNWTLVSSAIGNGLMTIFDFAYTFLSTFNFQNLGVSFANMLIGILTTMDWSIVGGTFGSVLQGIIALGFEFVTTFDWAGEGYSLSEIVNGFLTTTDWSIVGSTFGSVLQGIIALGFEFVTTFDWAGAGYSLSEIVNGFFYEIDWAMAAQTISEGLKGLLITIITFFSETDWEQIGNDIGDFIMNIDWLGILFRVVQAIATIFSSITDIYKGLIQKCPLMALPLAPFLGLILLGDLLQGDLGIIEWAVGIAKSVWDGIKSIWSNAGKFFSYIWTSIKLAFSSVTDWFKNVFSTAWQAVKNIFCQGGKVFEGIKSGILGVFKTVVNGLIDGINAVIKIPFDGINTALSTIKGISIAGFEPFDWIDTITVPQIPKLATGTVVPANYGEFLAVLGDNNRETEVVSPLSTMKKAFKEALLEGDFGGNNSENQEINIYLDSEKIFKVMVDKNFKHKKRHGKSAFA